MLQFPFPVPPSDVPLDPPGIVAQLFVCLLVVFGWFEMIVWILPERWRHKVCELQFGPCWAARNRRES
jgi:hypothetical protein